MDYIGQSMGFFLTFYSIDEGGIPVFRQIIRSLRVKLFTYASTLGDREIKTQRRIWAKTGHSRPLEGGTDSHTPVLTCQL